MSILQKLLSEGSVEDEEFELDDLDSIDDSGYEGDEDVLEESALYRMAAALNVFNEGITAEELNEQMSIVRLNRQAKTANLAARAALLMARSNNDPLYQKYAKFNGMRLQLKAAIFKKYGTKANARARAMISGATVQPLNKR